MDALKDLFDAARAAQARAYAPYSRFRVGAAIRGQSGAVFSGCNVENAAYPTGVCAEASAISAMVLAGELRISEILVISNGLQPITPCGACRQRIHEFSSANTKVHSAGANGVNMSSGIGELLPHAFGPVDLARRKRTVEDKP